MYKLGTIATASAIVIAAAFVPPAAKAEPTSVPVYITAVRPYGPGNDVFLTTSNADGTFCPRSFYWINLGSNSGKAMYAAALTALAANKPVRLELLNGSCEVGPAGSNALQSVFILSQ